MSEAPDWYRKTLEAPAANLVHIDSSMNMILEYVYRLAKEARGTLECVVFMNVVENGKETQERCARVHVKKDGRYCFFYILLEISPRTLRKWRITGKSILIHDAIRMPDYTKEMIWFG